ICPTISSVLSMTGSHPWVGGSAPAWRPGPLTARPRRARSRVLVRPPPAAPHSLFVQGLRSTEPTLNLKHSGKKRGPTAPALSRLRRVIRDSVVRCPPHGVTRPAATADGDDRQLRDLAGCRSAGGILDGRAGVRFRALSDRGRGQCVTGTDSRGAHEVAARL